MVTLMQASDGPSSSDDEETIRLLRQELKEKTSEMTNLEMRLEKMKQHSNHFREVSVAAEESLKQVGGWVEMQNA